MSHLIVDSITSLDGHAPAEGWPGWWGLEARAPCLARRATRPLWISCSVVSPDRACWSARCRFALLRQTPTNSAASATGPPAATKAARTSTGRAVGARGSALAP